MCFALNEVQLKLIRHIRKRFSTQALEDVTFDWREIRRENTSKHGRLKGDQLFNPVPLSTYFQQYTSEILQNFKCLISTTTHKTSGGRQSEKRKSLAPAWSIQHWSLDWLCNPMLFVTLREVHLYYIFDLNRTIWHLFLVKLVNYSSVTERHYYDFYTN